MLVLCAYQAWQARTLSTEFQETQHILHVLLILGGVFGIGLPVLGLNTTNPDITVFISSVMIFASCISILFMMFVPKFRYKEKKEQPTWSCVATAGATTEAGAAALTGSAITISNNSSEGTTGSFNFGEKILTTKTNKELLTEIDTLRRRLREHEAGVFIEEQQHGGTSDSTDNNNKSE
jgi:heme A synthase